MKQYTGKTLEDKSLSGILNGISELASGGNKPVEIVKYLADSVGTFTKDELCTSLGITTEVLDEIMSGQRNMILTIKNGLPCKNYIALLLDALEERQRVAIGDVDDPASPTLSFSYLLIHDVDLQKYYVEEL